jgi:hypothetical protein
VGPYAAGVAFSAITFGSSAMVAALLLRRLPKLAGAPRWLAAALLLTFALIGVHMVPGVLGVLTRGTVAATAVLAAAGTWLFVSRRPVDVTAPSDDPATPPGPRHAHLLAGVAGAAIAVCIAAYYRTDASHSVTSDDMLNFHLPLVASWIQSGSFWPVVELLPYDTTGNYPQNGDVLMLASVLPWRGDAFARFAVLPYIGLVGLATYALGVELRADRARAALMACVVTATPILLLAGVVSALPDVVTYGTFGAGLVFLVRCARIRSMSDAVLAGLGLGLAFGTKWYAVPAVAATLVVFAAALLLERLDRRAAARLVGAAVGTVALAGGFWLVRNAVESGSPFFPAGWLPIGARSDLGNPAPRTDFPLAHYLFDGRIWRDVILPDELRAFGGGGILLLAAAVVAAALATRAVRSGDRAGRPVLWALVVAAALAVVYVLTPNSASGFEGKPVLVYYSARYLVPAAIPAAAAMAWAATRAGRLGVAIDVLAAVAVADGLRRAFDLSRGHLAAGVVVVAVLGAALWGASRLRTMQRRRGFALTAAAAAALIVAGGYALDRRFADHRLRGQDATLDYFLAHTRDGERVGLAEEWSVLPPAPVLAMFGDRLRNRVTYVGEHQEGVNKPYRDPARFATRLARDRYVWLMIGRGMRPPTVTPAMTWATANGYARVSQTDRLALYRRTARP